jgi:Carbohydrate binding domain.
MKINRLFSIMALFAIILSSCTKGDPITESLDAKFFSTIGAMDTRASNTSWAANDAIGIYALNTGNPLAAANIYNGNENIKHVTTIGNGVFTAAVPAETIQFPANGDDLDFIAYYPYQTTISGYIYPVDVANQSNLPNIDLLYSNNAIQKDNSSPVVTLNFKHLLSKLVLNIETGAGISNLTGLTVSVNDLNTKANFSLVDGTIPTASFSVPQAVTPTVAAVTTTTATTEAILIPGQDLQNAEIIFTLGGENYKWTPGAKLLASTKKYTYNIKLSLAGVILVEPDGTITDWDEDGDPTGTPIELNPEVPSTVITGVTPTTLTFAATVDSDVITFDSTEDWTIAADQPWVTFTPALGLAGTAISVTVDAAANSGAARTATITITATTSGETATIAVSQAGTAPAVVNLALNPSFEDFTTAVPDNWTQAGGMSLTAITTGAQDGTSAVQISASGSTGRLEQIITGIIPGETYEVSFWYKDNTQGTNVQGIRIWSNFRNGAAAITPTAGDGLQPDSFAPVSTWTKYVITVTAPATADSFLFGIRATNGHTGIIDNCSFVKL